MFSNKVCVACLECEKNNENFHLKDCDSGSKNQPIKIQFL